MSEVKRPATADVLQALRDVDCYTIVQDPEEYATPRVLAEAVRELAWLLITDAEYQHDKDAHRALLADEMARAIVKEGE